MTSPAQPRYLLKEGKIISIDESPQGQQPLVMEIEDDDYGGLRKKKKDKQKR